MKKLILSVIVLCFGFSALADSQTPYSHLDMTAEERNAMEFLYRYLPLPDEAGYTPEFWLENVQASLRAREEMPWGKSVPDREWRHFVLPVRVNNEALDKSRSVFFEELKERVKGMSMEEAILETNHWLHEKATYRPSDSRTSSPLSTVSQAIGRCGEESTLGVAAFRAIGIPARQVYTPRWAHTDDNHAWVEVWADGRWHFLGACEPEPMLDLAWFNAPASRGMMMNTNVFGEYDGPEEVLERTDVTTRINVTSNYAPVRTVKARVVDTEGNPVKDADISFCIYNYAEYYPVSTKKTDSNGVAQTIAGVGDMIVWASHGDNFGLAKASPSIDDPVEVVLKFENNSSGSMDFDIVPPKGGTEIPYVSHKMRDENDRRFALEDSIRNAYTSTFVSEEQARRIAEAHGVDPDRFSRLIMESRGNSHDILFILDQSDIVGQMADCYGGENKPEDSASGTTLVQSLIEALEAVTEKDRRDIPMAVLQNTMLGNMHKEGMDPNLYINYVNNPRIETEPLTDWQEPLLLHFWWEAGHPDIFSGGNSIADLNEWKSDFTPDSLASWVRHNIELTQERNPQNLRMTPMSVWEKKKANKVNRDIFYVALLRSFMIPARIEPITGVPQYHNGNDWVNISLDEIASKENDENRFGYLSLDFTPTKTITDPKYYSSFSISRIDNGKARQLEWPEDATWSSTFVKPVRLEAGQYILTSGQRLADGGVLARSTVFVITPDITTSVPLEIRSTEGALQVIGNLDAETIYHDLATGLDKSILSTTGRGYYTIALINPAHEPSAHVLNDLSAVSSALEEDGRKILVLFASDEDASRFVKDNFKGIPSNVVYGVDRESRIATQLKESLHLASDERPIVAIADSFNRIVFYTQGYVIGTGETLLRHLRTLD